MRALSFVFALLLAAPVFAQGLSDIKPGDKVKVREGDSWTDVEVIKREGRKVQVRYDDGTEEWVGSDRLKPDGGDDVPAGSKPSGKPSKKMPSKDSGEGGFAVGDKVEILWVSSWKPGKILKVEKGRYFISWDGWSESSNEWVTADRVRVPGSGPAMEPPGARRPGKSTGRNTPKTKRNSGSNEPPPADLPETTDGDISDAKTLDLSTESATWSYTPDKPTVATGEILPTISAKITHEGHFTTTGNLLVSGNKAIVVHHDRAPGQPGKTVLEPIDLLTGKTFTPWMAPEDTTALEFSPSGKRVLLRNDGFGFGKKNCLFLYELASPPNCLGAIKPYPTDDWAKTDIAWAALVDDEHALTLGGKDTTLVLWNMTNQTAVWKVNLPWWTQPALSPGRKHLAIATEKGLVILETMSGELVAGMASSAGVGKLAFSADGTRLAKLNGESVIVWDLKDGSIYRDLAVPNPNQKAPIFVENDFLLVHDTLVSLEKRLPIWRYELPNRNGVILPAGRRMLYAADDKVVKLGSAVLPHGAARAAADAIGPNSYLISPNTKVRVEVNAGGDGDSVRKGLIDALEKSNLTVDDGAEITVRAVIKAGQNRSVEYNERGPGNPFGKVTRSWVEQIHTVTILDGSGKSAWERSFATTAPFFLGGFQRDPEEQFKKATGPQPQWFSTIKFPSHVAKPGLPVGNSKLPPGGIK
jgi:hypothetical protein